MGSKQMQMLERDLEDVRGAHASMRQGTAEQESILRDREQRVFVLQQQLAEEERSAALVRIEADALRNDNERLAQSREDAVRSHGEIVVRQRGEWQQRLDQAAERERRLTEDLDTLRTKVVCETEELTLQLDEQRRSVEQVRLQLEEKHLSESEQLRLRYEQLYEQEQLDHQHGLQERHEVELQHLREELLCEQQRERQRISPPPARPPLEEDPFILRATASIEAGADALSRAGEVHAEAVEGQLIAASGSSRSELRYQERLHEYPRSRELESERRACARKVEVAGLDLYAMLEEAEVQHHLPAAAQQRLMTQILMQLHLVDHERHLLSLHGPLDDLPDTLIETLVEAHHHGITKQFDSGYSPVHWSAENGRRDLIEYLRRCPGGHELLRSPDTHGRTPEVYAQEGGRGGLALWLRKVALKPPTERAISTPSCLPSAQEPPQSEQRGCHVVVEEDSRSRQTTLAEEQKTIPELYIRTMHKVELYGWDHMDWTNNFTLLHWGAKNNLPSLCSWCLTHGGDPAFRDDYGYNAFDYATECRSWAALERVRRSPSLRCDGESLTSAAYDLPRGSVP